MNKRLSLAYAVILFAAAIAAVAIMGLKTKNLAATCLIAGIAMTALNSIKNQSWTSLFKWIVPLAAFILFAYRSAINLLALIGIIQHELDQYDAYNKCINLIFLIFLAGASLMVAMINFATIETKSEI